MNDFGIFVFGMVVFAVVILSTFCSLIATDKPNEE